MNLASPELDFNNVAALLARASRRQDLTELEAGLVRVTSAAFNRCQRGGDLESEVSLIRLTDRLRERLNIHNGQVIPFPSRFHRSVRMFAPQLQRAA